MRVSKAEASQGAGSWPTFHHDSSRSGFSTDQAPTSPRILWSYQTKGQIKASPVVANGVVYFGSDDGFYAVNQASGSLSWRKTFDAGGPTSAAIYDGSVYVGSIGGGGNLYRLNASTGQQLWNFSVSIYSSILAAGGRIYFSGGGGVYSLDALTGSVAWTFFNVTAPRELCYANGLIFTSSGYFSDGSIYALNATDGALVWKLKTPAAVLGGPSVARGVLYAGGNILVGTLSPFLALNATTGTVLWRANVPALGSAAVAYGLLYLNAGTGVDALNQSTGSIVWGYGFRTFGISPSIPAVTGGMVFVGGGTETGISDPTIYALDVFTGHLVWSLPVGVAANGSPAISGGVVYVGADDGKLYAIGQASDPALLYAALLSTAAGISFLVALLFYRRSRKQRLVFPRSDTI